MEDIRAKHIDRLRRAMSEMAMSVSAAFEVYQQEVLDAQQDMLDEAERRFAVIRGEIPSTEETNGTQTKTSETEHVQTTETTNPLDPPPVEPVDRISRLAHNANQI